MQPLPLADRGPVSLPILFFVSLSITLSLIAGPTLGWFSTSKNSNRQRRHIQDTCHLREMEICATGALSIIQNPNGLPSTPTELKRQCEFMNESVKCFEDYAENCLTKNQNNMINLFVTNSVQLARDFCRLDSELRQNYTKHVAFQGIHKLEPALRLPLACCNIGRLKECIFVPTDNECGVSATDTIEHLLGVAFGGVYYLPCRNYNSTNPACSKLLPKIGTKPYNGRNVSALSKIISGFVNVPAQL